MSAFSRTTGEPLLRNATRAALLLVALVTATLISAPAHAQPVTPRPGEGFIAMTARTCGSTTGWSANQTRAGTTWAYLGRTYDIQCGAQRADTRASRNAARTATVTSGWVHPLASGIRASGPGACPGAPRAGHRHAGIDLTARTGTAIRSVGGGQVVLSRYSGSAGWYVRIDHGRYTSTYMHLVRQGARVGTNVAPGTVIGHVGSTGNAKGPHLHFEATGNGNTAQSARANGLGLGC